VRATGPESLCLTCTFARPVRGRLGQNYLLCRNDVVPAKYPAQPVRACTGYNAERDQASGDGER